MQVLQSKINNKRVDDLENVQSVILKTIKNTLKDYTSQVNFTDIKLHLWTTDVILARAIPPISQHVTRFVN